MTVDNNVENNGDGVATTSPDFAHQHLVVMVVPVYANAATLAALAERVGAAFEGRRWRLRLVIDASPDESLAIARALAATDARIGVTDLAENVGQHRALARGLLDEPVGSAWVCLDADLQDPPEAVPVLVDRLAEGDVDAVFAGRRGAYEGAGRRTSGRVHRAVLALLTGLPPDAGAFVAMGPAARASVLALGGPSLVAAIGVSAVRTTSIPVARDVRPIGCSTWTSAARLRQSVKTLAWAAAHRANGSVCL